MIDSSAGFSLLEISITLFLTSILCSIELCTSMMFWRAGKMFELRWEQNGMISNLQRNVTSDIHEAKSAVLYAKKLHFIMMDNREYTLAVNQNHQLVEYMPSGGITVLSDSVDSYDANIEGKVVTVKIKLQTGSTAFVTGDMLGGSS